MEIFYTQDFLEYIATAMMTMPCVLTSGNIDGCTITDGVVLGPAGMRGKRHDAVSKEGVRSIQKEVKLNNKKVSGEALWDFSSSTDYVTTTDFIYDEQPSAGLIKTVFELCFNSNSEYLVVPFSTSSDLCPSTTTDDYGGSSPSIYWDGGNSLVDFWGCTVGSPLVLSGTSISFYFNESSPEYQCTVPELSIGFGTNPSNIAPESQPAYGGFIFANKNIILPDETNLILYAGLLGETVKNGGSAGVLQYVMSADVVII